MPPPNFDEGITFGPFRMPHLAEQVDDRFSKAFRSYLAEKVMPLLDGRVEQVQGRVYSHYDRPQWLQRPEFKSRYYYEINFFSPKGVEEAWGELDYHRDTATWTPSQTKPPSVRTLTFKRKARALSNSHLYRQERPAECPQCHSNRVAGIIYGVPTYSAALRAELDSGRSCFGGEWAWDESKQWRCLSCKHEWGLTGYVLALRDLEKQE
jgi:hypothetical protein